MSMETLVVPASSTRKLMKLSKNALSLFSLGMADRVARFLFTIVAVRALSQYAFGGYILIQTLLTFGGLLVNFGIDIVVVRMVSQYRSKAGRLLSAAIVTMLILALPAWGGIVGLAHLLRYPAEVRQLVLLAGGALPAMAVSQACIAILKALERMEIFALVSGALSLVAAFSGIVALLTGSGLSILVWLLVIRAVVDGAILLYVVHTRFVSLVLGWNIALLRLLLRCAAPIALLTMYSVLLRWVDILLLGRLRTLDDVAIYGAVVRLNDLLALIGASLVGALFPMLSARWEDSRAASWALFEKSLSVFSVLGFPVAFGTTILAAPVLRLLFGETYVPGALALALLGWTFFFNVIGGPVGSLLIIAADRLGRLILLVGLVVALNVGLNLLLLPRFSYGGAAAVALLCAMANFGLRVNLIRSYFARPIHLGKIVVRPALAALVMSGFLILFRRLHPLLSVPVGVLVYLVALTALGEFRQRQYHFLQETVNSLPWEMGKRALRRITG
jgi:O-antigen/teichoic acid export membrane protein